ncbi:hypothetical protein KY285_033525 [Solanum tuberosum]|nr:hypothetical protein KY285_033525 [Solanum tuberosum]
MQTPQTEWQRKQVEQGEQTMIEPTKKKGQVSQVTPAGVSISPIQNHHTQPVGQEEDKWKEVRGKSAARSSQRSLQVIEVSNLNEFNFFNEQITGQGVEEVCFYYCVWTSYIRGERKPVDCYCLAEMNVVQLIFATDLLLFSRGDPKSVKLLYDLFTIFSKQMRRRMLAVYFGGVPKEVQQEILHLLGFVQGTLPLRQALCWKEEVIWALQNFKGRQAKAKIFRMALAASFAQLAAAQVRDDVSWAEPKLPTWALYLIVGSFVILFAIIIVCIYMGYRRRRGMPDAAAAIEMQGALVAAQGAPVAAQDAAVAAQVAPVEVRQPVDSDAIIDTFPMIVFSDHDGGECVICSEDYTDGDRLRILPCEHMYHHDCISGWWSTGVIQCPICRHDYYSLGL